MSWRWRAAPGGGPSVSLSAQHLTVIDSSPETLDLNRNRVGRPDVDYVAADLFSWQPQQTYDTESWKSSTSPTN